MEVDKQILKQFADNLVSDFRNATPVATGQTRDSIGLSLRQKGFDISISAHVRALIDGRKPTSAGAKKSTPTLQQAVLEWIKARSITPNEPSMTLLSLSWAISKSIHKRGFRGKGNFYDGIVTQSRIDSLVKTILDKEAPVIQSNIINQFKFQ